MALLGQLMDDVIVHRFEIKDQMTIGRHHTADLQIDEEAVSGHHAIVSVLANKDFPEFNEFYLEDLNSTNGTFINDNKVTGKTRLRHNDIVRVAWNKFKFIDDKETEYEKTVHMMDG